MNLNKMIQMNKFGWKQNVLKDQIIYSPKILQEDHTPFKIGKEI